MAPQSRTHDTLVLFVISFNEVIEKQLCLQLRMESVVDAPDGVLFLARKVVLERDAKFFEGQPNRSQSRTILSKAKWSTSQMNITLRSSM